MSEVVAYKDSNNNYWDITGIRFENLEPQIRKGIECMNCNVKSGKEKPRLKNNPNNNIYFNFIFILVSKYERHYY